MTTKKASTKKTNEKANELNTVNLDAILKDAETLLIKKTNSNTQKGLYKFVFATSEKDLDFVNAKKHVKSLNFEKRNTSGQRSKFRKHLSQLINAFNNASDKKDKETIIIGFLKYYSDVYLINDFTPESLCSMSSNNYDSICDFLEETKKVKIQKLGYKELFAQIQKAS